MSVSKKWRIAAAVAATATMLSSTALTGNAVDNPDATRTAAQWLVSSKTKVSADLLLALAASGAEQDATLRVERELEVQIKDTAVISAGTAAKTIIAISAMGNNPYDFGGKNLVEIVTKAAATDPSLGYAFSGALGVIALIRAGEPVPPAMLTSLVSSQLPSGAWGGSWGEDKDTTGIALLALAAAPQTPEITAAIDKGVAWTATSQTNGYWDSGYSPANTTAMVMQALQQLGKDTTAPEKWLLDQQKLTGGKGWAASLNGTEPNVMATTQVMPAISGTPMNRVMFSPVASGVMGDASGDRIADIWTVSDRGELQFRRGFADKTLPPARTIGSGFANKTQMTVISDPTDVSGRGTALLTVDDKGALWAHRASGLTGVTSIGQFGQGWSGMDKIIPVRNLAGGSTQYIVARRKSDGALFGYVVKKDSLYGIGQIGYNWNGMAHLIGIGDMNGDGRADLMGIHQNGDLWAYNGTADGRIGNGRKVGWGWQGYTKVVAVGDMSGNGTIDMVGIDSRGLVYHYDRIGSGFQTKRKIGEGGNSYKLIA